MAYASLAGSGSAARNGVRQREHAAAGRPFR